MRPSVLISLWVLPALALARPEGTPQLGLTQGLESTAQLRVQIAAAGERIRVCSSDDGLQEAPVGETPLDENPGAENPVTAGREGAEIVVTPPGGEACQADATCAATQRCLTVADGLPVDAAHPDGRCSFAFPVVPTRGRCTAADRPEAWVEVVADAPGVWSVDLAAEPETLTESGSSTRYFEVEVIGEDGTPVDGGRLFARQWLLNAHTFDYATDAEYYAVAEVGDGAHVFVIDFAEMRGFRYSMLANRSGLEAHPSRSWCQFGEAAPDRTCPFFNQAPLQRTPPLHNVYLSYPDPPPLPAPEPALGAVTFQDEAGTPSLSPNGDGVQDDGTFTFESNVRATYKIIIDTNGDGVFDSSVDRQLTGLAEAGGAAVPWDGADRDGVPLPDGEYAFEVSLLTGETHFPMADIEDNAAGFVIWRQTSADPGSRVPERMFWDDAAVRGAEDLVPDTDDAVEVVPEGSVGAQRRRWNQRASVNPESGNPEDMPMIFDTWAVGAQVTVTRASCRRCDAPFDRIRIGGEDEPGDGDQDGLDDLEEAALGTDPGNPDSDEDGLPDGVEVNGANPTDPTDPDSDGDGLPDGREDANQDGAFDAGETDPNNPDTDGDTLLDGAEDADGDGIVDVDETDPRTPDTDGDGIRDDEEGASSPDSGAGAGGGDGGVGDDGGVRTGEGDGGEAFDDSLSGGESCSCEAIPPTTGVGWLLLLVALRRRRR